MITIKTKEEIELIRKACCVVVEIMNRLKEYLKPGVSTAELDKQAKRLFASLGAVSAFKGYRGYPAHICASINEQVVHGIPGKRQLREGDIISLDVGAKLNGYFGDAAWTFPVGKISAQVGEFLQVALTALNCGTAKAQVGGQLSDISNAIQTHVEYAGFSVVRQFVGHGIGTQMHEEPEIPNFGDPGCGPLLKAGMVLAIEPMVNSGSSAVMILADQWTAITKDRKLSAHFEHTVCVTNAGPEILTAGIENN